MFALSSIRDQDPETDGRQPEEERAPAHRRGGDRKNAIRVSGRESGSGVDEGAPPWL